MRCDKTGGNVWLPRDNVWHHGDFFLLTPEILLARLVPVDCFPAHNYNNLINYTAESIIHTFRDNSSWTMLLDCWQDHGYTGVRLAELISQG